MGLLMSQLVEWLLYRQSQSAPDQEKALAPEQSIDGWSNAELKSNRMQVEFDHSGDKEHVAQFASALEVWISFVEKCYPTQCPEMRKHTVSNERLQK
jgi:hypothetical protein